MSGSKDFFDYKPSSARVQCPACKRWDAYTWYGDPQGGDRVLETYEECFSCGVSLHVLLEIRVTVEESDE
jgi:hypothetical protein